MKWFDTASLNSDKSSFDMTMIECDLACLWPKKKEEEEEAHVWLMGGGDEFTRN